MFTENTDICVIIAKMMDMRNTIDLIQNQLNEVLEVNSFLTKKTKLRISVWNYRAIALGRKKYRM